MLILGMPRGPSGVNDPLEEPERGWRMEGEEEGEG